MNLKKLVKESLALLEKADKGVIFQDFDNRIIHVADAAFYGKQVYPKDLIKTLDENFSISGFPLSDSQFRRDVLELIQKYEESIKHKSRNKSFHLDEDFGKIV